MDIRKPLVVNLGDNPYLVETAGYVPIKVKFKQFVENGIMSRLRSEQYDSFLSTADLEKAFEEPDFTLNDDDDIFSATDKINARKQYVESLKLRSSGSAGEASNGQKGEVPSATKEDVSVEHSEDVKEN